MRKILRILAVVAFLMPVISFAVGLGNISVYSALNQRLNAQIPIVDVGSISLDSVNAVLATPQQFSLVGLDRDPNLSQLRFNVLRSQNGQAYVQISSAEPIDAPVVTFLLNLTWPNGQMLREYTVFLDPLNYAKKPVEQLQPATSNNSAQVQQTIQSANTYGPTTSEDDLWEIAQKTRPEGISTQQNMVAIFRKNQDAFTNNNINRLRAGYLLNLPSKTEASQLSTAAAIGVLKQQDRTATSATSTQPAAPAAVNTENTPQSTGAAPTMPAQPSGSSQPSAATQSPAAMPAANATQPVQTLPEPLQGSTPANDININNAPEEIQLTPENQLQQEGDSFRQTHQLTPPSTSLSATEKALGNDSQRSRNTATLLSQQLIAMQKQLIEKDRQILTLEKMLADQNKAVPAAKGKSPAPTQTAPQAVAQGGEIQISYGLPWYAFPLLFIVILVSLFLGVFMQKRRMLAPQYDLAKIKEQPLPHVIIPEPKLPEAQATETSATAPIDFLAQSEKLVDQGLYQKAIDMLADLYGKNPNDFGIGIKLMEIYGLAKQKQNFIDCYQSLELTASSTTQKGLLKTISNLFPDLQPNLPAPTGGDGDEVTLSSFSLEPSKIIPESSTLTSVPATQAPVSAQDENVLEFDVELTNQALDRGTPAEPKVQATPQVDEAVWDKMLSNLSLETESTSADTPDTANEPEQIDPLDHQDKPAQIDWTTQIDLAKAYLDMGDIDEAKEILEQVIEQGDEQQKTAAQALLAQFPR